MLHEEVEVKWDELQYIVEDFQLLEKLRSSLPAGVSIVLRVPFLFYMVSQVLVANVWQYIIRIKLRKKCYTNIDRFLRSLPE